MKIEFSDKSYIEVKKSSAGKVFVVIQAKDQTNSLKNITNAVEITKEQLMELINDI